MNDATQISQRIYGFLLKLYPKSFRQEFGEEMKYVFSKLLKEAYTQNGKYGFINIWTRTIIDTGKSLIVQYFEYQKGDYTMKTNKTDIIMQNKIFVWIALVTGLILLLPLLLMRITGEVNWDETDFIIMGTLIFGIGSIFVLSARKVRNSTHRIILAIVLTLTFLYTWAELAVGVFTNWGS